VAPGHEVLVRGEPAAAGKGNGGAGGGNAAVAVGDMPFWRAEREKGMAECAKDLRESLWRELDPLLAESGGSGHPVIHAEEVEHLHPRGGRPLCNKE